MNFEKRSDSIELLNEIVTCCTGTQCKEGYLDSGDRSKKVHGTVLGDQRNQTYSGNCG
jgi:hypothetical protein